MIIASSSCVMMGHHDVTFPLYLRCFGLDCARRPRSADRMWSTTPACSYQADLRLGLHFEEAEMRPRYSSLHQHQYLMGGTSKPNL
jgi:hypothetical protein